jgi:hypothetical protein
MSQTYMPRLAAPVERTIPGAAVADAGAVTPSMNTFRVPFADEGDE